MYVYWYSSNRRWPVASYNREAQAALVARAYPSRSLAQSPDNIAGTSSVITARSFRSYRSVFFFLSHLPAAFPSADPSIFLYLSASPAPTLPFFTLPFFLSVSLSRYPPRLFLPARQRGERSSRSTTSGLKRAASSSLDPALFAWPGRHVRSEPRETTILTSHRRGEIAVIAWRNSCVPV